MPYARVLLPVLVALCLGGSQQSPTEAQQRPVFRGGTHFVRVDAYPLENGKIVQGLKPEDFEVLEDGKPQAIESFDFITFEGFTPEAERRDPESQRAGFDLAADPRYRVFVVFVDLVLSKSPGPFAAMDDVPRLQQPLIEFFERIVGPRDLYGFLTTRNTVKDLVLAQKTTVTVSQIKDMWRANVIDRDDADEALWTCDGTAGDIDALKLRHRADANYTTLQGLVAQLGSLRQERKNLVLATNLLPKWRGDRALYERLANARRGAVPRTGIERGRITNDKRDILTNDRNANANGCLAEAERLALLDFEPRYRELMDAAVRENVAVYTITPGGLQAPPELAMQRAMRAAYDDLKSLSEATGGVAVTDTNDLNAAFRRIADDLSAYYLLGYYATNTKFDGGVRKITVRVKGKPVRARREYRAPTQAEIAALAQSSAASAAAKAAAATATVSPREAALTILERANRPFVPYVAAAGKTLTVVAELSAASIQAGRWKDGADVAVEALAATGEPIGSAKARLEAGSYAVAVPLAVTAAWPARVTVTLGGSAERPVSDWVKIEPPSGRLVGDAIAYRAASRVAPRPVAAFEFARNERLHAEWPVLAPLDRREVRLLDRAGKPLPVELPLSEDTGKKALVVEMSLSGLPRGDYLIELTAGSGSTVEQHLLAIRIKP